MNHPSPVILICSSKIPFLGPSFYLRGNGLASFYLSHSIMNQINLIIIISTMQNITSFVYNKITLMVLREPYTFFNFLTRYLSYLYPTIIKFFTKCYHYNHSIVGLQY